MKLQSNSKELTFQTMIMNNLKDLKMQFKKLERVNLKRIIS